MRLSQAPRAVICTIGILSLCGSSTASPFWWPRDVQTDNTTPTSAEPSHNATLEARACANPCGWYGQLCCESGQTCTTDANNQAQCSSKGGAVAAPAAAGYWQYYTTTYVATGAVTKTDVISSFIPGQSVTAAGTGTKDCNYALNQAPCGSVCCGSGEYCVTPGQCAAAGGGSSEGYAGSYTAPASAPLRPTTGSTVVVTSPTTTMPFGTPVATGANITLTPAEAQGGGGLSGGAIAGIVIGVLLGIGLLFLLCFCFCAKAFIDILKGIFGMGKKRKRTETEYIEEHHHHTSGGLGAGAAAAAALAGGRRWHGDRPSKPEKPKKGGLGGMGAMAAGLGALAIGLGLKRKHDKKQKSEYTGSSYDYSYDYSSYSKLYPSTLRSNMMTDNFTGVSSSDRRTRRSSRHSRH
jgi:hypothetical protein